MSEPKLEDIEDYHTLKGEKKKVVWGVILAGVLLGVLYVAISSIYGTADDSIETSDTIKNIPLK